jgi:Domain of Unknown Function (DUF1080)
MAVGDVLHADTFDRANGAIGTASDGHSYTIAGSGTWSITSNTLKLLNPNSGAAGNAAHGGAASGDVAACFDLYFNDVNPTEGMFLRGSYGSSYWVGASTNDFILTVVVSGSRSNLARADNILSVNTWYSVRAVLVGTQLKAKIWERGTSEPANWTVEATDSTYSSGGCGFFLVGGSSTSRFVQFDAFTLTEADSFTSSKSRTVPAVCSVATLMPRSVPTVAALSGAARRYVPAAAWYKATLGRTIGAVGAIAEAERGLHVRTLPDRVEFAIRRESTVTVTDRDGQRSTCEFTLVDMSDTYSLSEGQRFELSGDGERLFLGFVESISSERLPANTPKFHVIRGKDERYLAEKRYYQGDEFKGEVAGSIAVEMHASLLEDEGVTALYARDFDYNAATWNEGTLSHVTTDERGSLTLALSGSRLDVLENTTAAFGAGTLVDVSATSVGTLTLSPTTAIKLSGFANAAKGTDLGVARKVWGGTQSIASGDRLIYDIWCPSTSPEAKAGVDLIFSDKSYLKKGAKKDQYGVLSAPSTDLASRAHDQWYHREIVLTSYAGKSIKSVLVELEGDKSGHYSAYFKNIKLLSGAGATKATFFAGTLQTNVQASNKGYTQVSCTGVVTYPESGTRTTPAYSLGGMTYATSSLVQWVADIPENTTLTLSSQVGGGPPAECEQNKELPNLPAGSYVTGKDIALVQEFALSGPDPTVTPTLRATRLLVTPAYYQDKYDVEDLDIDASSLGTGVLTNLTADSTGLSITGFVRDWDDGDYTTDQTLYASGGSPLADVDDGSLTLTCNQTYELRLRQDGAGQWQNFVAELDVYIAATSTANQGLIFRTESAAWTNTKGRFAYWLWLDDVTMKLDRGASGGTITNIASVAGDFPTDSWHRLKVICNGTSIQGYIDDELYIDATDSTHNHTGYLGPGFWNDTAGPATGQFDNFGVMGLAMSGTRVHPSLDLSTVGEVYRSQITWDADVPDVCSLLVEASVDGGSTYVACENGGVIPGLEQGVDATALSLLVRETMTSANANATPRLRSVWVRVNGRSTAGGYRISPPLNVTSVLHQLGSSSITWDADVPVDTALVVEVSRNDGGTWAPVSSGDAIPGVAPAPDLWSDGFDTDTSASYALL